MRHIIQKCIRHFIRDDKAAVMPIVALTLPVILGMTALGVDGSLYVKQRNSLQSAADAAALAAAWERAHKGPRTYAEDAARREAAKNGFNSDNGTLEVVFDTDNNSSEEYVEVSVQETGRMYFASFLSSEPAGIAADARALASQKAQGPFCLVSLNDSDKGAILTHGNGKIDSPKCGMAVNSRNDAGLQLKGNVDLDLDMVRLAGNYEQKGGSGDFNYNNLKTGQSPLENPYKDITPPAPTKTCSKKDTKKATVIKKDTTLSPGTYCGGITIKSNADVTFEDGNYQIYGGELNMSSSKSNLISNNASIILTGDNKSGYAQLDITGGTLDLEAPSKSFSMAGMAIYQDPDAPETKKHDANKIAGNAEITVDGVVYLPSQGISFKGTSGISNPGGCTRIVANKIELGGTPDLFSNCEESAAPSFTQPFARLVN